MSFTTSSNRLYVTDANGNIKFDTQSKYPFIIGSISGSETFTNTSTRFTTEVVSGESFSTVTAYFGSEIDSTRILSTPAYPISFLFASIKLSSVSNVGESPADAYYYYHIPIGREYSSNGSLLTELEVNKNGRVVRAAQISCFINSNNQIVMHFKRSASNNDLSIAASLTFQYNIQYGRITI